MLLLSLLGLFVLVALVTLVLLLSNPKTRVATLALLGVFGVIPVLLLSFAFMARTASRVSPPAPNIKPRPVVAPPSAAKALPSPIGRGVGGKDSAADEKTALTLTLSQRERGRETAKTRPAWVNASPQLIGDVYQMSIAIGPYTTRAECDAKLPEALQEALDQYAGVCLSDQAVDDVQLPADYLRQQLVKAQWEEIRQHSIGPMTWLHVQLQFDRKIKDRILEEHRQAIIARRLRAATTWSAAGLALLMVAFGYLKIDLATGGAYRGRLRAAAVVVILGVVCVVFGLWSWGFGLG